MRCKSHYYQMCKFKIHPFISPYMFNAQLVRNIVNILRNHNSKETSIKARDIGEALGISAKKIADCLQQNVMQKCVKSYKSRIDGIKRYWWRK